MKVSLIVPIYNEAEHLESFLRALDAIDLGVPTELVFVDDASRDGSSEILRAFRFVKPHVVIQHPENRGKGAALATGIARSSGDIVGIQDADFEYDLSDVPRLIEPLLTGKADVVYGSRFRKDSTQVHRTFHYLVNRGLTLLSNLLSGLYVSDMETCYKFFRADILKNIKLESKRFGFEPEVTAKISRLKCRIMELPISYYPRSYIDGKKITWRDGVAAVFHIARFNLFRSMEACFEPTIPQRYVPRHRQWL